MKPKTAEVTGCRKLHNVELRVLGESEIYRMMILMWISNSVCENVDWMAYLFSRRYK